MEMARARKIVTEAAELTVKNINTMLRLIALLLITPLLLLTLLHSLIAMPLMSRVEDNYEASSLNQKDVISLLALEIPFAFAFLLIWLFGISSTIAAAALAHGNSNKHLFSFQEFMLLWIKSTSKKIIHSSLYALFVMLTFVVLVLASVALIQAIFSTSTAAASFISRIIVSAAAFFYPYLSSICGLGLVISVLEDGIQGRWALEEARKMVNDGRRVQSCILMLILTLLDTPIYVLYYVTAMDDDDDRLTYITTIPFIFVATTLWCLANYFTFVVFTLLYLEIKSTTLGDLRVEMQPGIGYCLVPSTAFENTNNACS